MCVVCASLRPWTPDCAYAGADGAGLGASASDRSWAGLETLTAAEIGDKLLTDYWNSARPRSFDAEVGDTLTYDVSALTSEGRDLARAALAEWSTVTGLRFEEVTGGFRPERVTREGGDVPASRSTSAVVEIGEAFEGSIGAGDRDWVRIELPSSGTVRFVLEGAGSSALRSPSLALYDALGRPLEIGVHHFDDRAEVSVGITGGGGTYYAQVQGLGGRTGDYRLSVYEPGARGAADIAFDDERAGAYAETTLSGDEIKTADINVSRDWLEDNGSDVASYGFQTYLHEIGHALGLGHPGDYRNDAEFGIHAEYANDSWQTSVMSYFSQTENPNVRASKAYAVTPMIGDVEAVRALYGSPEVREGDTVYGFDSTAGGTLDEVTGGGRAVAFTIVDTGGRDLVNFWRTGRDQRVDLNEGEVSDVLGHRGNMTVALGTRLEDARLGWGDDDLTGTDAANTLRGGGGDDVVRGRDGDDRLHGDDGEDVLWGGDGRDRLEGGDGDDDLRGQDGDDRLSGEDGDDRLDGGEGEDRLKGGAGDDELLGGDDKDKLKGGGGRDRLDGGEGKDKLKGGGGADVFVLGDDFDRAKIKDFDDGEGDRIDVSDLGAIRSWRDLRDEHLRDKGNKIVLKAGDDGKAKIFGVDLGELSADDFLF